MEAGMDHTLSVFKGAIKEAIYLGRTLVINKFSIDSKHNLGYPAEHLEYKRYINLDKTQIYKIKQDGSLQQINDLFHYIDAENFNLNEYSEKDILLLPIIKEEMPRRYLKSVTEKENNRYKVIIRSTTHCRYTQLYDNILVRFCPSDEVEYLTDVVLKSLGTSLANAKKMSLTYQGVDFAANNETFYYKTPDAIPYYIALHVRADDSYQQWPENRYWTSHRHLKHIINHSCSVYKGRNMYIMSDIQDRCYFDFLKKNYKVYRYFDFPDLEALVSKNNDCEVDNAMLYSVEKNILQYAHIKIVKSKYYPKIIYIDSSFRIPLLSIHPLYLRPQFLRRRFLEINRRFIEIIRKILRRLMY